jgi:hypothetical protein
MAGRYVILRHDFPGIHFDLMLEAGPVLRTWRLDEPPAAGRPAAAEQSFDHRLLYLDYEGPVSGGRGSVARWDAGTYAGDLGPDAAVVRLEGGRLRGGLELRRREGPVWEVVYRPGGGQKDAEPGA